MTTLNTLPPFNCSVQRVLEYTIITQLQPDCRR